MANATQGLELVLQALQLAPQSACCCPRSLLWPPPRRCCAQAISPVLADVECTHLAADARHCRRGACAQTRIDAVLPVAHSWYAARHAGVAAIRARHRLAPL